MKPRLLNNSGIIHIFSVLVVVVLFAIVGIGYVVVSHADTPCIDQQFSQALGSSGQCVQSIKFFIKLKDDDAGRADVLTLTPNPSFDSNTTQAVKNYQVAEGIYASGKATGVVDANGGVWTHICDDIGAWSNNLSPYTDEATFLSYATPTGCSTVPAPAPVATIGTPPGATPPNGATTTTIVGTTAPAVPATSASTGTTVNGIGGPAPTTSAPNLALNMPCVASSVSDDGTTGAVLPCTNAFDGNLATRWSSAYSDPGWIYVDLGNDYNINEVYLSWETAYATAFQIQVSNDAVNWTTIYSTTTGTGGVNDLTGLSGAGRYVRMYGSARGTQWGYSLWEMQVFGSIVPVAVVIPTPTPTPVTTTPTPTKPVTTTPNPGGATTASVHTKSATRSNIVEILRSQVNNPWLQKYGGPGPSVSWCAYFATWVWRTAGINIPNYPAVSDIQGWGQARGTWIPISSVNDNKATPKIGDAVIFGTAHVGIVASVSGHGSATKISIISGNYGNAVRITPSINNIAVDYPRNFSNTQNSSGTFVSGFVDPL